MPQIQDPPLRVVCNPYSSLDGEGRAVGVCSHDIRTMGRNSFVGAVRAHKPASTKARAPGDLRSPEMELTFRFFPDIIEVPAEEYYLRKVRRGELLAADQATAQACGITDFREPAIQYGIEKARVVEEFRAAHPGHDPICLTEDPFQAKPKAGDSSSGQAAPTKAKTKSGGTPAPDSNDSSKG